MKSKALRMFLVLTHSVRLKADYTHLGSVGGEYMEYSENNKLQRGIKCMVIIMGVWGQ